MVALNVDFGTITPAIGGGLPVKPDGWYTGSVTQTVSKGTRDSAQTGNAFLECTISYQDGSTYIERFNIWNNSEDARRIASENMAAMFAAMGLTGQQLQIGDTSQFHNLPFEHYLSVEETLTDKGNKIKQNRLKAVRLKDGKVIGNVPPAPPAGATAAPQAGFSAPAAPAAPAAAQPWGGGAPAAPPAGGGFPAPGAPAPGFGGAPTGLGLPAPGAPAAPQGGFPAPGAPAQGGGFPAPGAGGPAPWGAPQG